MLSAIEKKRGQPFHIAELPENDDLMLRVAQLVCHFGEHVQLEQGFAQEEASKPLQRKPKDGGRGQRLRGIDVVPIVRDPKQVTRPHEAKDRAVSVWHMPAYPHDSTI